MAHHYLGMRLNLESTPKVEFSCCCLRGYDKSSSYPLFASPEIPSKSRDCGCIIITTYFLYLL